jgi:hypothetical protein
MPCDLSDDVVADIIGTADPVTSMSDVDILVDELHRWMGMRDEFGRTSLADFILFHLIFEPFERENFTKEEAIANRRFEERFKFWRALSPAEIDTINKLRCKLCGKPMAESVCNHSVN